MTIKSCSVERAFKEESLFIMRSYKFDNFTSRFSRKLGRIELAIARQQLERRRAQPDRRRG